ncbi:MAG: adhesion protein FadA [Fusobacteriaceae bacterium]|jgi:hypothetical protein|nr:adhesion protein FadA [Fusobacteriaceae bacterium]
MKKVLVALGAVLFALSVGATSADEVRAKYEALEQSYQALEAQEEAKYQEMKNDAAAAEAQLVKQRALEAQITAKIPQLKKAAKNSENGDDYAQLAADFEGALGELKGAIKENEKKIAEFQKLDAIKNPPVKEPKPAKPAKPAKETKKPAKKK